MDKIYVLYSKTRNVVYMDYLTHSDFWSLYLRNKYPRDNWVMTDIDSYEYREFSHDEKRATRKIVLLYDSTDVNSRKLCNEINIAKNQMAIEFINNKQEEKPTDQFIVFKSIRGEAVLVYLGFDIDQATEAYQNTRTADCIEVWRDGKYVNSVYGKSDYIDKVTNRRTS